MIKLKKGDKIFITTVSKFTSIPEVTLTLSEKDIEFDEAELYIRDAGHHGNLYTYTFFDPKPIFEDRIALNVFFYENHILL